MHWPPAVSTNIMADAGRLRQVLLNLAANAIKFTETGRVTIRAFSDADGMLRIEVEDTGIGITPEQLSRLFAKFTQADSSTTRKYGGTGSGPGDFQTAGRTDGRPDRRAQPARRGLDVLVHAAARHNAPTPPPRIECWRWIRRSSCSAAASRRHRSTSRAVLVVEDHAVNRMLATRLLAKLGCEVDLAENGRVACERTCPAELRSDLHGLPDAGDGRLRSHAHHSRARARRRTDTRPSSRSPPMP